MFDASALSRSDPSPHMRANSHATIALDYRAEKVIRAYSELTKQTHQTYEEKTHDCDCLTNQQTTIKQRKCISVKKKKRKCTY